MVADVDERYLTLISDNREDEPELSDCTPLFALVTASFKVMLVC
jgi:hypothetical protein